MLRVYSCISTEHDLRLIVLAVLISLIASTTACSLSRHFATLPGRTVYRSLVPGVVWGAGIWSMHFIAMLAFQPHLPSVYSPALSILSAMIATLMSALGWRVAIIPHRLSAVGAAFLMTLGIFMTHFVGMSALRTVGHIIYDVPLILAVTAISAGLTFAAVHLAKRDNFPLPLIPAALFTAAVCTLHLGAMAAATIVPDPRMALPASTVDSGSLAVLIASVVLVLLLLALVTAIMQSRLIRNMAEDVNRLKNFADNANEGLAIISAGAIVDANRNFWLMAGCDDKAPPKLLPIAALLPAYLSCDPDRPKRDGFDAASLIRVDDSRLDVEVQLQVEDIHGVQRQLLIVRNLSVGRKAAARLAHFMTHDPLTGAANRAAFADALKLVLSREPSAALLCLDLDRFKAINDLHGHAVGDAVLVEVARRIRACLTEGEDLARVGGAEFAIIQRGGEQPGKAGHLTQRILGSVSGDLVIAGKVIQTGLNIGVALCPNDAISAADLHKKANLALQRAKTEGRGICRFFDAAMDQQLLMRHQLAADLGKAVSTDQFQLHYQPIISLASKQTVAFEALLRWNHPVLGNISPAVFIPIAEESGAILEIGEWVLRTACREAAGWRNPLRIAVNFSVAQFASGDMEKLVTSALANTGLAPDRLDIEVTEGLLLNNAHNALATLRVLQALGVGVSMDDFGTGYSSLSYFRLFPFNKVKIDQSFVRDMASNKQAAMLVDAIIGLGKGLGLSVIAEGVETAEQQDMLRASGCDEAQGYGIARPAPIEHFRDIVDHFPAIRTDRPLAAAKTNWHEEARRMLTARLG